MIRVFNDDGKLNVGGFQLRLRGGMPTKEPAALTPSALNQYPVIPCCTILLRLLPHTQASIESFSHNSYSICLKCMLHCGNQCYMLYIDQNLKV